MARRRVPGIARTTKSPILLKALAEDPSPEARRAALANPLCTPDLTKTIADTLDWTAGGDFDCRGAALVLVRYPDYYPSNNPSFNAGLFLHLTSIQARPDQQLACRRCQPHHFGVFKRNTPALIKMVEKVWKPIKARPRTGSPPGPESTVSETSETL